MADVEDQFNVQGSDSQPWNRTVATHLIRRSLGLIGPKPPLLADNVAQHFADLPRVKIDPDSQLRANYPTAFRAYRL